jgi:hypothetical protein
LLGLVEGIVKGHRLTDLLLEELASLGSTISNSELECGNVFELKCFLEVGLTRDRDEFLFIVKVVELDGPDFIEGGAEGLTRLECERLV